MCESVRQSVRLIDEKILWKNRYKLHLHLLLIGGIGSDTLVDCETAKPESKSAGPGPCKRPSERRSLRRDWEIAHQKQSSGTGLTIFPT